MTRRTRTAWLVVGKDGWPHHVGATLVEVRQKHEAFGAPLLSEYIRFKYPWPPAKKRRSKC